MSRVPEECATCILTETLLAAANGGGEHGGTE
jgi:hypothetical protein